MIHIKGNSEVTKRVLSILLDNNSPITVSKLASQVSMSERTVRSYLKSMQKELQHNGIELIIKPNVGVYLTADEEQKKLIRTELAEDKAGKADYSPEYRHYYILKTLLRNKYTYTIQLLAEELYCSKSTIVNDLVDIQKWLEKRDLFLKRKQNQGLWIEGSEKNYRRGLMDLFLESKENGILDSDSAVDRLDYRIDFVNYKKLKSMFPRTNLQLLQDMVQKSEQMLGYSFTDQAFINLITHIAITIERVKSDKQIQMTEDFLENLKGKYEYEVAQWLVEKLSSELKVRFSEDEVGYISLHMLGAKIQEEVGTENCDNLLDTQNEFYIGIAREIINLAGDILKVDLKNDKILLTALTLHLRPTAVRLQYGLNLKNPMLHTIKNEYTSIFGAAWACSSIFEKKLGVPVTEDEIAYIAMHIAVAVGRLSNKVRAIVVCSSGIGTSQLVTTRLKKLFSELDITATIPLGLVTENLENSADLIISTIPGILSGPKVVYVSTMLDATDMVKIKSALGRLQISGPNMEKGNEDVRDALMSQVIDQDLCFIDHTHDGFEQIIRRYGSVMESKGYVKKGFVEDVLMRERRGSTFIGRGIAIPHGKCEHVKHASLAFARLHNEIKWSEEETAKYVFLIAVSDADAGNEHLKILAQLSRNIMDEGFRRMVEEAHDIEHILSLLKLQKAS